MAKAVLLLLTVKEGKYIRGMWRQKLKKPLACLTLAALMLVPASPAVAATSSGGGNGLRISPVRTDLVINPGASQVVEVNVTNVTNKAATLQTIVNDFVGNPDESGNPAILLDPGAYAPNHSLKRFITTSGNFTL